MSRGHAVELDQEKRSGIYRELVICLAQPNHYMLGSCRDHRAACEQGWIIAG